MIGLLLRQFRQPVSHACMQLTKQTTPTFQANTGPTMTELLILLVFYGMTEVRTSQDYQNSCRTVTSCVCSFIVQGLQGIQYRRTIEIIQGEYVIIITESIKKCKSVGDKNKKEQAE